MGVQIKIRVLRRVLRLALRRTEIREWVVRRALFWCDRIGVSERVANNFVSLLTTIMERIGTETGNPEFPDTPEGDGAE